MGISEGREKEKIAENIWRIVSQNFSNLIINANPHIQESQWSPKIKNTERATPKHIIITWWKPKKKPWEQQEKND